jgi:hypothetical protein
MFLFGRTQLLLKASRLEKISQILDRRTQDLRRAGHRMKQDKGVDAPFNKATNLSTFLSDTHLNSAYKDVCICNPYVKNRTAGW